MEASAHDLLAAVTSTRRAPVVPRRLGQEEGYSLDTGRNLKGRHTVEALNLVFQFLVIGVRTHIYERHFVPPPGVYLDSLFSKVQGPTPPSQRVGWTF